MECDGTNGSTMHVSRGDYTNEGVVYDAEAYPYPLYRASAGIYQHRIAHDSEL